MPKPLFVGEAPSKNEPLPRPIEGRIGKRLANFAGVSFEEFLERTQRVNLLDVRQDTREKGFEFDRRTAIKKAHELLSQFKPTQNVVLLGKRVADAFGVIKPYFEPHHLGVGNPATFVGTIIYVVPHPSGVNRWYNSVENRIAMSSFMRSLFNA